MVRLLPCLWWTETHVAWPGVGGSKGKSCLKFKLEGLEKGKKRTVGLKARIRKSTLSLEQTGVEQMWYGSTYLGFVLRWGEEEEKKENNTSKKGMAERRILCQAIDHIDEEALVSRIRAGNVSLPYWLWIFYGPQSFCIASRSGWWVETIELTPRAQSHEHIFFFDCECLIISPLLPSSLPLFCPLFPLLLKLHLPPHFTPHLHHQSLQNTSKRQWQRNALKLRRRWAWTLPQQLKEAIPVRRSRVNRCL